MSWQEGVAVAVVLLGLGAGAFLVAQRPSFWIEFGSRVAKALLPLAWRYVSKRMSPEEEAAWRAAERRGQGDQWLKQLVPGEAEHTDLRAVQKAKAYPKLSPRGSSAS